MVVTVRPAERLLGQGDDRSTLHDVESRLIWHMSGISTFGLVKCDIIKRTVLLLTLRTLAAKGECDGIKSVSSPTPARSRTRAQPMAIALIFAFREYQRY